MKYFYINFHTNFLKRILAGQLTILIIFCVITGFIILTGFSNQQNIFPIRKRMTPIATFIKNGSFATFSYNIVIYFLFYTYT